jgi:hypothetical protein
MCLRLRGKVPMATDNAAYRSASARRRRLFTRPSRSLVVWLLSPEIRRALRRRLSEAIPPTWIAGTWGVSRSVSGQISQKRTSGPWRPTPGSFRVRHVTRERQSQELRADKDDCASPTQRGSPGGCEYPSRTRGGCKRRSGCAMIRACRIICPRSQPFVTQPRPIQFRKLLSGWS